VSGALTPGRRAILTGMLRQLAGPVALFALVPTLILLEPARAVSGTLALLLAVGLVGGLTWSVWAVSIARRRWLGYDSRCPLCAEPAVCICVANDVVERRCCACGFAWRLERA
jgi:hypothetical protein